MVLLTVRIKGTSLTFTILFLTGLNNGQLFIFGEVYYTQYLTREFSPANSLQDLMGYVAAVFPDSNYSFSQLGFNARNQGQKLFISEIYGNHT